MSKITLLKMLSCFLGAFQAIDFIMKSKYKTTGRIQPECSDTDSMAFQGNGNIEAHGCRIMSFAQRLDEDRRLKLHSNLAHITLLGDGYDEYNVLKSNILTFWHRHAFTVSGQGLGLLVWAQTYEDHCAHTHKLSQMLYGYPSTLPTCITSAPAPNAVSKLLHVCAAARCH